MTFAIKRLQLHTTHKEPNSLLLVALPIACIVVYAAMVFSFMPSKGGALRHWYKLKKDYFRRRVEAVNSFYLPPLTLFDFNRSDDAEDAVEVSYDIHARRWTISDDSVIGGYSRGSAYLIRNEREYQRHMGIDDIDGSIFLHTKDASLSPPSPPSATGAADDHSGGVEKTPDQPFIPFLRWNGTVDTSIGEKSRATRSGFCAIRSPEFPGWNGLNIGSRYNAIEITCRSDGRAFTFNVKTSSYFPDELYQGVIAVGPTHATRSDICQRTGGDFVTLVLPLEDFVLTRHGRELETQREMDGGIILEHLGITLMDGKDGDFEFDLARIRVINYVRGRIMEGKEQQDDVVFEVEREPWRFGDRN